MKQVVAYVGGGFLIGNVLGYIMQKEFKSKKLQDEEDDVNFYKIGVEFGTIVGFFAFIKNLNV